MTTDIKPYMPALVDKNGELITLSLEPLTTEQAGERYPQMLEIRKMVNRYCGFLEDTLASAMKDAGQVEKRVGETVFELKAEATWSITDESALVDALLNAVALGDLTAEEMGSAMAERVSLAWHHGRLTTLAKRIPRINQLRVRTEGPAKLRIK